MNLLQPIAGFTMNEPTLPPEDRLLRSGGILLNEIITFS